MQTISLVLIKYLIHIPRLHPAEFPLKMTSALQEDFKKWTLCVAENQQALCNKKRKRKKGSVMQMKLINCNITWPDLLLKQQSKQSI